MLNSGRYFPHTVGRIGTPEDMVKRLYLFLASKEAGFISGHTLHANGGAMPV